VGRAVMAAVAADRAATDRRSVFKIFANEDRVATIGHPVLVWTCAILTFRG